MTSKERLLTALDNRQPDRLPVTTHHIMPYFTEKYMNDISAEEFFDRFEMDAIRWAAPLTGDPDRGEYRDPDQEDPGFLQVSRVSSDSWRVGIEELPDNQYSSTRHTIHTPKGTLTAVLQANDYTEWVSEHLIKEKKDIDLVARYQTFPICDVEKVNREAEEFGERGIIRG